MSAKGISDRLIAELAEYVADGLVVVDATGTHLFVNRAFREMTGFSAEELLGHGPPHPYWPPEHLEEIVSAFRHTIEGAPESFLFTFRHKDETRFPVGVSPAFVEAEDGETYIIATVRDRTDRVRQEEVLDQSLLLVDTLVRAGALGWWMWHLQDGWAKTSDSYYRVMGWEPGTWEASYEEWAQRVHPDDIGDADESMKALISGETDMYESEHRFRTENGEWRWMLARGFVMERTTDGAAALVAGTVQDVDRTRRQQEKLEQFYKMEIVGQMAGGIAHDFNNLLMAMSGNLELIDVDPASQAASHLREIRAVLDRAGDLTRSLLRYARSDVAESESELVDLSVALRNLEPVARRTIGSIARVAWTVPEGPCFAEIPRAPFDSCLLNVIINARDAMNAPEGRIEMIADLRVLRGEKARRMGVPNGPMMRIRIIDNGRGMPRDVLERAFDPLFTTKPLGHGTGLGLPMVRKFIDEVDGGVRLESTEGKGSVVTLFIPLREDVLDHEVTEEFVEGDEIEAGPGGTVLVVDDEPALLRMIARQLSRAGYTVHASSNPRHALSVLGREPVDLMVTDIVMPFTMDGVGLAARAAAMRPGLPIVFVTGYSDSVRLSRATELGVVVEKPFRMRRLFDAVRAGLEDARAPGADSGPAHGSPADPDSGH